MWYTTSTGFSAVMLFILMMSHCLDLVLGSQGTISIFLNSPENCTTGKEIIVGPDDDYLIKTNVDPDNSTSELLSPDADGVLCSLLFKSSSKTGKICFAQAGPPSDISDVIPELLVHDGNDKQGKTLSNYNHCTSNKEGITTDGCTNKDFFINQRERCTSQDHLYFSLNSRDTSKKANISRVELAFHVYSIDNVHRMLFLDENYFTLCSDHIQCEPFKMQASWLSVYNRVPLSFEYYKKDENGTKTTINIKRPFPDQKYQTVRDRICVAVMPLDNWRCVQSWELRVCPQFHSCLAVNCTQRSIMRNCWGTHILSLTMQELGNIFTATGPKEPLNMFRIVVTDLVRSVDELDKELEEEKKKETPAKPALTISPASGDFDEGSKVTLTCTTTTTHHPDGVTYTFSKDGTEVKETELGAPNHYVIEKYATASHAGSYTCVAVRYHSMMYYLSDPSEALLVYAKGKAPTPTPTPTTTGTTQTTTEDNQDNAESGSPYMSSSVMLLAMSTVTSLFFTSQ